MREEKKRLIGNEKGRNERTEKGKQSENNVSNENEIHRCSTGLELQSFAIYQIYFDRASMRHLSKFVYVILFDKFTSMNRISIFYFLFSLVSRC